MATEMSAQRLAYLHIRDSIVAGYLPAGSKIQPKTIAGYLRISRLPVRDALYQLDAEGFVQVVVNRGAYVRSYSGEDIVDLSEMRAALEGLAGRLAVDRITPRTLSEIEHLLNRTQRCQNDFREFLTRHDEFHLYLYELSGRDYLVSEIRRLRLIHRPYLLDYCLANNEQEMLGFEHDLILDELRRRDPAGVDRAIQVHVMRNAGNIARFTASREKRGRRLFGPRERDVASIVPVESRV
jgi:DNA-binding GntR family transcriptional regulator